MTDSAAGGTKFNRSGLILDHGKEQKLDDLYTVDKKKLGEGTYGSVSQGKHKSTGNIRAVKTMAKDKVSNIPRFKEEIRIMHLLDHPNIIRLYETFEDAKNIYLVLELCTGGELFDKIIDEGNFSEKKAAHIMNQILAAIYYCHKNNIVHRDLKPENFLLGSKAEDAPLKVIDFGLAAKFDWGKNDLKTKAGTPYYVAPQVLEGKYDQKCDVWSCGVIAYVLLCGYPPFFGDTDPEILGRVKKAEFDFPDEDWSGISKDAKDLITQCLLKDPKKRLEAEQALNHAWIQKTDSHSDAIIQKTGAGIFEKLKIFRNQNRMKKVALTVVAQHCADKEIEELKATFAAFDKNRDGSVSVQEMKEGLTKHGIKLSPDLEKIMQEVDSDGSGAIDYTEFIAATLDKRLYIKNDAMWAAFRQFDLDGDGKITQEELSKVLVQDNDHLEEHFGKDTVARMLKEVDANGDGVIDFDEFKAMMMKDSK